MPIYRNKQRNSWYCSFYYTDWTGKRKRKKKEGFSSRKEAREYETTFLMQRQGYCDMIFGALAELYFGRLQKSLQTYVLFAKEISDQN